MNTNELSERDRSQIYLEMSKNAVKSTIWACTKQEPTDAMVLGEWNRLFEQTAKLFAKEQA